MVLGWLTPLIEGCLMLSVGSAISGVVVAVAFVVACVF